MLFRKNYDGLLFRFLEKDLHDGPTRGHFVEETTTHKILGQDTTIQLFLKMPILMSGHVNSAS
jgi:hypothetical protein